MKKFRVTVTIDKEFDITLTPNLFCGMTEPEFIAEFNRTISEAKDIGDIAKYAAVLAAQGGYGVAHDGIGVLMHHYSSDVGNADVIVRELYEDVETRISDER